MAQSLRALVSDLVSASQQIQSSDVLQEVQKILMIGEDPGDTRQDQADGKLVKMLQTILPDVIGLLKRLHVERQDLEQSNMQLLTKQTDHVQKMHHLEELRSELQTKTMELHSVFTQQEAELEGQKATIKDLGKEISRKAIEWERSEEERKQLERDLRKSRADCLTKEKRLAALHLDLRSIESDSSAGKKDMAQLVKENKKLRRNLDIVCEQEEEVRNRFIVNKQATNKLKETLQVKEDACRTLAAQIEVLQAAHSSLLAENMAAKSAGGKRKLLTVSVQTDDRTPMEWRVMDDLLRDIQDISQDSTLIAEQLRKRNSELQERVGKRPSNTERLPPSHQATPSTFRPQEQAERKEATTEHLGIQRLQQDNLQRVGQRGNPATPAPLPQNLQHAWLRSPLHAQPSSMNPTKQRQGELAVPRRDISTWPTTTRHLGRRVDSVDESALDDEGPVRFPPGNP